MGIMRRLAKSKLIFVETKDVVETTLALDNYRRACDSGRGAIFLSIARGKVRYRCWICCHTATVDLVSERILTTLSPGIGGHQL